MPQLELVPYEGRFLAGIEDLWREQYPPDHVETRKALFEWFATQNPFLDGQAPYFVLLDGDRVVGMLGHMPVLFHLNGSTRRAHFAQDILISTAYRGRGLGRLLVSGVAARVPSFAAALWFNEPNHSVYAKCGWIDVENLVAQVLIYDPKVFLQSRIRNKALLNVASALGRAALSLKSAVRTERGAEGVRVGRVERFDDRFDRLFDDVAPHLGMAVVRTHRYLNWRYCDKPFSAYLRYAALDDRGELLGYLVSKIAPGPAGPEGVIVDLLVPPTRLDALSALVNRALGDFEAAKTGCVKILCSWKPARSYLSRLGFIQVRKPEYFMIFNPQSLAQHATLHDISNWYLTYADGDGDAWSVDKAPST